MRPPPERNPLPEPPDKPLFIGAARTTMKMKPSLLDCGAEGHIVTTTSCLDPSTVRESSMTTEAFSGASAPITHTGDHVSGLLPHCHVVPQSAFNLVAAGPYIDHTGCAIILLTSRLALQLQNLNVDKLVKSHNPTQYLLQRIQQTSPTGTPPVKCKIIGERSGPHDLYHTDLLATLPESSARSVVTNVAKNNRVKLFSNRQTPRPTTGSRTPNQSPVTPEPELETTRRLTWDDVLKQRVVNVCTAPSVPVDSPIRVNDLITAALKYKSKLLRGPPVRLQNPTTVFTNAATHTRANHTYQPSSP